MVEFFIHCPKCGRRFHIKLETKKMVHLERETYQRTDSSRHYRLTGSTLTVLREGPPITLDVEDFEDRYKCGHCGHEWTSYALEIHREQPAKPSKAARTPGLPKRPGSRLGPNQSRLIIALLIIGLVATASILGSAYALHRFGNGPCGGPTSNDPRYVRFTIVMSDTGYNDSYNRNPPYYNPLPPWPVMNVTVDSNVFIHVLNNDPNRNSQPHGFTITHYFEQGIALQSGECFNLAFTASTSGSFPVYSAVHDSVDGWEQAQLNVN